ncbi:MAG: TatD family hydrolase [Halobacteriovoraceae bacterium]|nr:TatD family hydrolase [Halobacteriovoraceae bacterium]MCB9095784.1 TatD family hydrolase [Halobacteriovoraceae bacterium]
MIETHCHLDYLKQDTLENILKRSHDEGVSKIMTIAVDPTNLSKVIEIANSHDNVFCSQGIHPHDAKDFTQEVKNTIIQNTQQNAKVLAIGEIGLDFHYNNSPPDVQKKVFEEQLQIALDLNKPIIIHTREADDETKDILKNFLPKLKGVLHSFTAGKELAEFALNAGFYLGFNGIITFKNAQSVRDIVDITPLDQLLIETDSPFLTPVPHRGKENAPFYLKHVAEKVAEIKRVSIEELIKVTTDNAHRLLDL